MDWLRWHHGYDVSAPMRERLRRVRGHVAECLDAAPRGPVHVSSVCAGDGRDLLPVLSRHPRRSDVQATLVELHPGLAARGSLGIEARGLAANARMLAADATDVDFWRSVPPARILLLCGVLGNVRDEDLPRLFSNITGLCSPGARVIWTRGLETLRRSTLKKILEGFESARLVPEVVRSDDATRHVIGRHRLVGQPAPLPVEGPLFVFSGPLSRGAGEVPDRTDPASDASEPAKPAAGDC